MLKFPLKIQGPEPVVIGLDIGINILWKHPA
jgi:hypothetical protein